MTVWRSRRRPPSASDLQCSYRRHFQQRQFHAHIGDASNNDSSKASFTGDNSGLVGVAQACQAANAMSGLLPLKDPSKEIRLLRLLPAPSGHSLSYSLTVTDIDSAPQYRAISYTWGSSTVMTPIHVNGHRLGIRMNCHHALSGVKQHFPESYIWTDAICIDQENIAEKNLQVRMMGRIFATAVSVLASVGSAGSDTMISMGLRHHGTSVNCQRASMRAALIYLWQRPYWSRLWVVQELHLAKNIEILLGNFKLEWPDLLRLSTQVFDSPEMLGPIASSLAKRTPLRSLDLVTLVVHFANLKCHDPRDHVYALLSMSSLQHFTVDVDYDAELLPLARDLALHSSSQGLRHIEEIQTIFRTLGIRSESGAAEQSAPRAKIRNHREVAIRPPLALSMTRMLSRGVPVEPWTRINGYVMTCLRAGTIHRVGIETMHNKILDLDAAGMEQVQYPDPMTTFQKSFYCQYQGLPHEQQFKRRHKFAQPALNPKYVNSLPDLEFPREALRTNEDDFYGEDLRPHDLVIATKSTGLYLRDWKGTLHARNPYDPEGERWPGLFETHEFLPNTALKGEYQHIIVARRCANGPYKLIGCSWIESNLMKEIRNRSMSVDLDGVKDPLLVMSEADAFDFVVSVLLHAPPHHSDFPKASKWEPKRDRYNFNDYHPADSFLLFYETI